MPAERERRSREGEPEPAQQSAGEDWRIVELMVFVGVGLTFTGAVLLSEIVHPVSLGITAAGALILLGCVHALGWWDGIVTVAKSVVGIVYVCGTVTVIGWVLVLLGDLIFGAGGRMP